MNLFRGYVLYAVMVMLLCNGYAMAADTLRHYNPQGTLVQMVTGDKDYVARFELSQWGTLTRLRIHTSGTGTGNFTVRIFGHEGGGAIPELEQSLSAPQIIRKTQPGNQVIEMDITPAIRLDNNQFFVMISNLPPNVALRADSRQPVPVCTDDQGGDMYYFFSRDAQDEWWLGERRALAVDAIFDYDPLPAVPLLEDVTAAAGFPLDLPAACIAAGDLNGDDFTDMVVSGRVFFNNRNGTFTEQTSISAPPAGIVLNPLIDINNDGLTDILALYHDPAAHILLLNKGNGNFEKSSFNLPIPVSGASSFSIADVNNDGYPDLFIGRLWTSYPSTGPDIVPNYLYLNDSNNSFTDASTMIYPSGWTHRRSRGSAWCDFDNDGDPDLFVSNYFLEPDELWQNNGDETFTNVAPAKGIDRNSQGGSGHGTGADWADYDNDGNFDLLLPMLAHPGFMTQYDHQPTTLYRNSGAPGFNFTAGQQDAGIQYEETHGGAAWADVNNDGLQDFYISAFYACRFSDLYTQNPDHTFSLQTVATDLYKFHGNGTDACWADYNGDGRIDLMTAAVDGGATRLKVFRNNMPGNNRHVLINVTSTSANKLAIGARVEVYAGGQRYIQEVTAGRGLSMQKPAMLHFGLGDAAAVDSVRVRWPGKTDWETFRQIRINALNYLEEGGNIRVGMPDVKERGVAPSFSIYPNPAGNTLTVAATPALQSGTIRITSITGQVMMMQSGLHGVHFRYDIARYPAGTYIVECIGETHTARIKLVKE